MGTQNTDQTVKKRKKKITSAPIFKSKLFRMLLLITALAIVWTVFKEPIKNYLISSLETVDFLLGDGASEEVSDVDIIYGEILSPSEISPEIPAEESAVDKFFNDSLFVGSAVFRNLEKYVLSARAEKPSLLGNSRFFCSNTFSTYENNNVSPSASSSHPYIEYTSEEETIRVKGTIADAIRTYGSKKIFICTAGLTELSVFGEESCAEKCANQMSVLLDSLSANFPSVEIVVVSTPYISSGCAQMKTLNNENIKRMNLLISEITVKKGYNFLNVSEYLSNGNGALKGEYCSDGFCHLNDDGCDALISALRYYAQN